MPRTEAQKKAAKKYAENNKEKLSEIRRIYNKTPMVCECGQTVRRSHLKQHHEKKHHILLLKKINNEITEDENRILNNIINEAKHMYPALKINGYFE